MRVSRFLELWRHFKCKSWKRCRCKDKSLKNDSWQQKLQEEFRISQFFWSRFKFGPPKERHQRQKDRMLSCDAFWIWGIWASEVQKFRFLTLISFSWLGCNMVWRKGPTFSAYSSNLRYKMTTKSGQQKVFSLALLPEQRAWEDYYVTTIAKSLHEQLD